MEKRASGKIGIPRTIFGLRHPKISLDTGDHNENVAEADADLILEFVDDDNRRTKVWLRRDAAEELRRVLEKEANKVKEVPADVKNLVEGAGGKINSAARLPDGSGFCTASFDLPKDHWLYADHDNIPPRGLLVGEASPARKMLEEKVIDAARYAVRTATMNGKEMDFDPDALVQNMVVGLLGYHTVTGLASDDEIR